jgi:hypothetical protein
LSLLWFGRILQEVCMHCLFPEVIYAYVPASSAGNTRECAAETWITAICSRHTSTHKPGAAAACYSSPVPRRALQELPVM